jgi:hypothetical protein
MKIAIVGGGISGLYCSFRLANAGHDTTVFEGKSWGGVIQSHQIDGVDYPISTLVIIEEDNEITNLFSQIGVNIISYDFSMTNNYETSYIALLLLATTLMATNKSTRPISIAIVVLMVIVLILVDNIYSRGVVDMNSYIDRQIALNMLWPIYYAFGSYKSKKQFTNLGVHTFSYKPISIFDKLKTAATDKKKLFYSPKGIGFVRLYEHYLHNTGATCINEKVHHIVADTFGFCIYHGKSMSLFDKVIIACNYDDYKDMFAMTDFERYYLSDISMFTFYSYLVKLKAPVVQTKKIKAYVELNKNIYLLPSTETLTSEDLKPNICTHFNKFQWRMGFIRTNENRRVIEEKINGTRGIHFIGCSIAKANGIYACMKHVDEHLAKHKLASLPPILRA